MNIQNTKNSTGFAENGFESWGGYMNAKIMKLEEQFQEESNKLSDSERLSNIFAGIAIFVNGYTEPSSEDLRLLMLLHGGIYHHYYRSEKTTHVIATNLPNAKMMQLKTMKVVKPEWITKSIEAGKLLDYKQFLLFAKQSKFQNELKFHGSKNESKQECSPGPSSVKRNQNVAKTAADSQFLVEFYNNSRLHHLSTMGAMFKQYVWELREKSAGYFPGRSKILDCFEEGKIEPMKSFTADKIVMHIDMDCFFVSVALRNHPELVGKPVAVAHARGNPTHQRQGVNRKFEYEFYKKKMETRLGLKNEESSDESNDDGENSSALNPWISEVDSMSEIASCSYEARKAGIYNGMYLGSALKLCPNLKTVAYDFEGYKEVSYTLYNTVAEYTVDIEAVSCDELFIDCSSLVRDTQIHPLDFSTMLRADIRERTRCPSSVGIGSNKLQARLATKRAKPNGQFYLTPVKVMNFMSEVDIYDLPGVGRTTGNKLKALNVKTCQDLQNLELSTLKKEFGGKTGETLYKHCRGIDDRPVTSAHQRKSVSAEVNYGIRFVNDEEAIVFLKRLSSEVANRLKEVKMKGRNITFKVMIRAKNAPTETAKFLGHGACDYTTRSSTLPVSSDDPELISKHVINMYHQLSIPATEYRGIGIQITKLEKCKQKFGGLYNYMKSDAELKDREKAATNESKSKEFNVKSLKKPEVLILPVKAAEDKLKLPPMSQIDRDVLNSLPKELRVEILNEYGIANVDEIKAPTVSSASNSLRLSQIDPNIFEELPDDLKAEIEEVVGQPKNLFNRIPLSQMRTMVSEWVKAEAEPRQFDIDMLTGYIGELVREKRIEHADILLKCFHRHIQNKRNGDENWVNCYKEITRRVQPFVREIFGKDLCVQPI